MTTGLTIACEVGEVVMQGDEARVDQRDHHTGRQCRHVEQIHRPRIVLRLRPVTVTCRDSLSSDSLNPNQSCAWYWDSRDVSKGAQRQAVASRA